MGTKKPLGRMEKQTGGVKRHTPGNEGEIHSKGGTEKRTIRGARRNAQQGGRRNAQQEGTEKRTNLIHRRTDARTHTLTERCSYRGGAHLKNTFWF